MGKTVISPKAVKVEDITSQITFAGGITLQSGGVYKYGKLVCVQIRVYSDTVTIQAGTQIITGGLPTPAGLTGGNSNVAFHCNRLGLSPYYTSNYNGISILQLSTETVQTGNAVYICGIYLSE